MSSEVPDTPLLLPHQLVLGTSLGAAPTCFAEIVTAASWALCTQGTGRTVSI